MISVIILIGNRRERAVKALQSILLQVPSVELEVLLLDTAAATRPPLAGSDHPAVRVIPLPDDTLFSTARAEGVRLARGSIVAFLEEHAWVYPGWAVALNLAFEGPWAGVGGEVHNANPATRGSRASELMNYHPWLPPASAGEARMLVGHNSSFRREVLLTYGDRLAGLLRSEVALFSRMIADGHRLYVDPAVKFAHMNASHIPSVTLACYLWNRTYAPTRAAVMQWSRSRRLFYVAAAPLMPFYFVAKLFRTLTIRRPALLADFFRYLPNIFIAQSAAALGYAAGLTLGPGRSEARFTCYEMNEERPVN